MDLQTLFENYQEEAFRLEILPQYKVEGEWEAFLEYKATGKILPDPEFESFVRDVSQKINSGAKHVRCRVLDNPLTDYEKFEIETGYKPLRDAGAEVLQIAREQFDTLLSKVSSPGFSPMDFWLFDNKTLVIMTYDKGGEWKGFEAVTDTKTVSNYILLKNRLLAESVSLNLTA
jgi:hypothetical protein